MLIKHLGSWSVTSDSLSGTWTQSGWDLELALSTAHSFGAHPLFSIYVSTDNKDNSENIITMDQGSLSFEDFNSYIGNDSRKYHDAFIQYFVEIGQLLGGGTGIDQMAEEVWQLEKALAGAFVKPSERADAVKMYNKMTLKEVQDLFSDSIDLSKYFKQYFGTNIPMNEQLIARVPDYFQRLAVIAKTASKRTLANHIVWSMVVPTINYMPAPYHLAKQKLKSAIFGVGILPVQWEKCVTATTDSLGFATGALYVEKYFKEEERMLAENMFSTIVKTFLERLPDKVWMDRDTKERAVEKVHALTHKIGYPDFISSVQQLDSYYSKMNVTDSAFDNFLNSEMFNIDLNKARHGKAPDKSEWDMSPAEINAYFQENSNQIVIPAGILQRPFFHSTFPQSFNFGAMGTIIGHELSHGFDNTGRRFDQSGNMAEWWSDSSAEEFDKRSKCFVDEYNDFTIYNHHLDGMSTLGENIADNGGIKISYQAYKTWLAGNDGEDLLLPGLNMTDDQQFFLGFAQIWCTYYNPQYAIQKLTTDVHSNAKYRVNGVVRNVPEFAKAFNCPPSSPLNPNTRCSLW